MISNISGFLLDTKQPFYISNKRPDSSIALSESETIVLLEKLPNDIIIRVSKLGLVEFDFSGWERTKAIPESKDGASRDLDGEWQVAKFRLLLMNVFLSAFYTSYECYHRVNMAKLVVTSKMQITSKSFGEPSLGYFKSHWYESYRISGSYWGHSTWTHPDVLNNAVENFKHLLEVDEKYWTLIENISVGHVNHQNNHYSQSVAIVWTVTEALLSIMWDVFLRPNFEPKLLRNAIKKHNKNKVHSLCARDYSSSVMINVLDELGIIDGDIKEKLHTIRLTRNNWIHGLKDIDMIVSHETLHVAIGLLNRFLPINLTWYPNSSWYTG